ncbi:putative secreted protein with PEP-CTERM sorting signal [Pseudoduganella flava]|nr:putative secreted protein with PEP-CTERM sorting signal [Pseudoduganella flava]
MMSATSYEGQPHTVVTSANFQFDTFAPAYLQLGLLDAEIYRGWGGAGDGQFELTISNHGTELFARSFDSLDAAQAFFSGYAVKLGEFGAGSQDLLVTAGFTLHGGAGFAFRYAVGVSPVPEPQTWMLMLLGGTLLMLRRRPRG